MKIVVLFGLPGAGKTFVGKIFQNKFGYYLYDGDQDLSQEMIDRIHRQVEITDRQRDIFFDQIITKANVLKLTHTKIVIAQTFLKEKYRKSFSKNVPGSTFVLIHTTPAIRKARLGQRKDYPLDAEYAERICNNFEPPHIKHATIINDSEGDTRVEKQIQSILNKGRSLV